MPHRVEFFTAAAPPPEAVLAAMKEAGFNVTHVYGLTETYGPATTNEWHSAWDKLPLAEQAAKKARQGVRYVPLEALDVLDPETMQPVPRDGETLGEVMFRGNVVMKGYLKNKASSDKAFAGGWFHSGDLGVMHPDGYVQLKDRSKDIIISGGENISSIEVEDALYKHPAVQAAAVVAKPDEKWGETPCAFVELKPGQNATSEELVAWCKNNLAGYKVPRYVVFAELPKTSTGKIQKFKLREMAKAVLSDLAAKAGRLRARSCRATHSARCESGHAASRLCPPYNATNAAEIDDGWITSALPQIIRRHHPLEVHPVDARTGGRPEAAGPKPNATGPAARRTAWCRPAC